MKVLLRVAAVLIGLTCVARAQLKVAGGLLVDVDAASLSAWTPNTAVSAWSNAGSLGGNFVPAMAGTGAVYQANVSGVPAVTFAASANSIMTNTVAPAASLLGANSVWSAEIWVLNPTLQGTEDQFAWTDRGSWTGLEDGTCMEIRYGSDAANAVEHNNGSCNIPWNGNPPMAGLWHHIVITRDVSGVERLYADGSLRVAKTPAVSNLRGGAPFAMGGVWDRGAKNWQMLFSGSISKVRVHSGTLSDGDVASNYQFESSQYQTIWAGAAGTPLPWADPANWQGGNVGENGETVWINNGGIAVLSGDLMLSHLFPAAGGLTISGGAKLTLGALASVELADNAAFALTVANGHLRVPGSGAINLNMGVRGGDATATVGGSGDPAVIDVDRDLIVAASAGSVGSLTVGDGGGVFVSNGWFYAASSLGAQATVTVNGGELGCRLPGKNLVVNANGARGEITVSNGLVNATADLVWSTGTATNIAYGAVMLNGGILRAQRLYASSTAGTNLLFLNGGMVEAVNSRTDFMYNLTAARVQAGGAVFSVPAGVAVTAAQALTEDPANTGGGLTKRGAGRITFAGANTFTGDIDVLAGDLFFSHTNGLPAGYAGTITLTNTEDTAIGYATAGGPALLLARLDTASKGALTLFPANAADAVDFSSFPAMRLAFVGALTYTGTFTPYQGDYTFETEGGTVTNGAVIADAGATPGHLTVIGANGSGMVLSGDNTFTGGAEIDGATVTLAHANALGVQGTPGVPDIDLRNGAVLRLTAAMDVNALVTGRITPGSAGVLLLGSANAAQNIDLSNHPGLTVGAAELSLDYAGTLTPAAATDTYLLGGGNQVFAGSSNRGLSVSNLADGAEATGVVIGTPGIVELKSGNTYSGGTAVTNRGVLFIKEDGLGAVPAAPDPDNLYVDNGVIRSGNANFTLPATRGVTVGAGGLELHPWGGFAMTVAGDLAGSGKITSTDSGWVTFAGANNTYSGLLDIPTGRNLRIGNGANFSWSPAGTFTVNGLLALNYNSDWALAYPFAGTGSLRKEGSGTLTLSGQNSYGGITYIDAGTLRVTATNVLPSGAGKGTVTIAAGATLETDGRDLQVGGLNGAGQVKDSVGTTAALYVGADNVTASFAGTTAPQLDVIKVGSGTQRLTHPNGSFANAEIRAGTLELFGATAVTGVVETVGGTLGVAFGTQGLNGKYYSLSAAPSPGDFVSYAAVTNFLNGKTPNVVQNSTAFGATFNALNNGSRFPAPYNVQTTVNFAVLWEGLFAAQTSGSYGFATASDDGSVLFIDGQMVVDNNAMQGYTTGDRTIVTFVELAAGMHEIAIAFYEKDGDQGLTVWVTLPGAEADQELPNNLLFSGTDSGEARIGTLAGAEGAVRFTDLGAATLRVTDDADMTYSGGFLGSNRLGCIVKEGAGVLTLDAGDSDHFGVLDVQTGGVVLTNGAGVLGTLSLASGTAAEVFGRTGLEMRFYNRSASDGEYGEFQSLGAWYTYLASTFPGGPNYVTNSLMLGANFDTGTGGTAWPAPYLQSGGAENDTYDFHALGTIFLDRTGTYAFGTASDDGSMLYIDGQMVVNNGFDQGVTARYGSIALTAGFHDIEILYRENTGGNALRAFIAYPGGTTNLLPQAILFSGAALRGLEGEAGSALNLGTGAAVVIDQEADTLFAGSFVGSGSAFIQKDGPGTLTLADDNAAYSGGYSVVGGTLRVGTGGLSGALGTGASVAVDAGGTLAFDRDGVVTVDGVISGNGLIVLDGPGEVRVTSSSAFTGTVLVNNGRLTFAPGATLGNAVIVTNSATVEIETSGTPYQSSLMDTLAGDGELVVSGTGTLVLNNANTYAGTTRVESGATVRVASPAALGGGGDVALDGGTLAIQPAVTPGANELAHPLDQAEWTRNGAAAWATRYDAQWLQITPNTGSQAGSAYCNTPIAAPYEPWYASFRYEIGDKMTDPADGIAFILQNDGRGLTALGASGGELGASGITPSIGIFFNIYQADSIGWIVDGARVGISTVINGLDLVAGVDVVVAYDGTKLIATVTQGEKVYTAERTVDLYAKFGGSTAYVGFTGGTGGATAQQFVGEFEMLDAVSASTDYANTVSIADGQSGALTVLLFAEDAAFSFGGLDLGAGATLNVSPAAGSMGNSDYSVAASNVTVAAGTGTVHVAANGAAAGVLGLDRLTLGSGARLVVTGAVSVPGGVLTVVVPTPVPQGVTHLADFTGATWVGGQPTIVLVDAAGNPINAAVTLHNGLLYINTVQGTVIRIR